MWSNYLGIALAICVTYSKEETGENDKQKLIYGGSQYKIAQAPYMAQYIANEFSVCAAVIVHKDFVLTAAHCYLPPYKQYIKVGSDKLNQGLPYSIQKTVLHPKYNSTTYNHDIAVIMLNKPLSFNSKVSPIKMAPRRIDLKNGELLMVIGFGQTEDTIQSANLQSVKVPYVNNENCYRILAYKNVNMPTENMMCAGGVQGEDACLGDSGGPLIYKNLLVGIVSFGFGCGSNFPGVYTRVSTSRNFIDETITQLSESRGSYFHAYRALSEKMQI